MQHAELSRVCILIRKGLKYERTYKYEDNSVSMCWIRLKTGRRKSLMVGRFYREWKSPNLQIPNCTKELDDQKNQLEKILKQVDNVVKENISYWPL